MADGLALRIRDADARGDAAACAEVYASYVRETAISFEEQPPPAREMARRIERAYVWLIAELDGGVAGYAYGARFAQRPAYRWSAEVTVYVDAAHHRAGVGRALYGELFERLRALGLWTLCAGVTQPNAASDGLHRAMGFVEVGTYRRIGFKLGAWQDVRWWQLDLRPGEAGPPGEGLEIFSR
ncbi:MAG TPA: GNAT family N-acetyltransferase [Solirubrobacteraceae bacterium]|nr:GNAT family N-acetyltransferase [Solirubrobacteraceae bacterium]